MLSAEIVELPKAMVPLPGSPGTLKINHKGLKAILHLELSVLPTPTPSPCVHSASVVRGLYDSGLILASLIAMGI